MNEKRTKKALNKINSSIGINFDGHQKRDLINNSFKYINKPISNCFNKGIYSLRDNNFNFVPYGLSFDGQVLITYKLLLPFKYKLCLEVLR
jgi:hypothetical protein